MKKFFTNMLKFVTLFICGMIALYLMFWGLIEIARPFYGFSMDPYLKILFMLVIEGIYLFLVIAACVAIGKFVEEKNLLPDM